MITMPRMSVITLGVADLGRATALYRRAFSTPPTTCYPGGRVIPLPDGNCREVAWGPMFEFSEHGNLRLKT